jgi:N4-gp56 family major capsid protein
MAITGFTTSDAAKKKLWMEKLYRETVKETFLTQMGMMGDGEDFIIQEKRDLTKQKGDELDFFLIPKLPGSGVTDGETLEGKEERLNEYSFSVTLKRYRNAVRHDYMSDKRVFFSISDEGARALRIWGTEKIETLVFDSLTSSPTRAMYTADGSTMATTTTFSTAKTALTTSSVITPKQIQYAKAWAATGGNRTQNPLRPVTIKGKKYFVLMVHPYVGYDLKLDSTYAQAQREADVRGKDNAIFTGALGVWDNVIVVESEYVPVDSDAGAGANVNWSHCLLLGAQAGVLGWGDTPDIVTKGFDYEEETGTAYRMTMKAEKAKFNSVDWASISFPVAYSLT